jgi:hypothetical protein
LAIGPEKRGLRQFHRQTPVLGEKGVGETSGRRLEIQGVIEGVRASAQGEDAVASEGFPHLVEEPGGGWLRRLAARLRETRFKEFDGAFASKTKGPKKKPEAWTCEGKVGVRRPA